MFDKAAKTPPLDSFRKPSINKVNDEDEVAKRNISVDQLSRQMQHDKIFFNTVQMTDEEYFPFGRPGCGAPMRNSNNEVITRLPKIQDVLWDRKPEDREGHNSSVFYQVKMRKQEVNDYIDMVAGGNKSNERQKKIISSQWRYPEPKRVVEPGVRSRNYVNDWFGRPGAGAPNNYFSSSGSSFDFGRNNNASLDSIGKFSSYTPSAFGSDLNLNKMRRSNHLNNYEMA